MEKSKKTVAPVEVGEEFELTFEEGKPIEKHGKTYKTIISRGRDGKIAIVNYKHELAKSVKPDSTWTVKVVAVEEKKIIVDPLELLRTSEENYNLKIEGLKGKAGVTVLKKSN